MDYGQPETIFCHCNVIMIGGEPETIYRVLVATGFARRWHIYVQDFPSGGRSDLPGGGILKLADLPGGGRSDLPSGGILPEWLTCTQELCVRRSRWTAVTPGSWSQILMCLSIRGLVHFSI